MIELTFKRDAWSFTIEDVKRVFEKIFDVKECPEEIDCLRGYAWELLSIDLKIAADEVLNNEQLAIDDNRNIQ